MQNVEILNCYNIYRFKRIKLSINFDFIKQITILRENKINSICRSNLQALLMLNKFENETWNLSNATLFTWLTDDDCKREEWKGDIKICSKSRISFVRKNYTLQTSHRISRMRNLWITRADITEDFDLLNWGSLGFHFYPMILFVESIIKTQQFLWKGFGYFLLTIWHPPPSCNLMLILYITSTNNQIEILHVLNSIAQNENNHLQHFDDIVKYLV